MTSLVAATALLIASHVLPSMPSIRTGLIDRLGRRGFYAAYSILSLLALGLVVLAYRAADPGPWLYTPVPGSRVIALVGMMPAVLLLVARLTTRTDPAASQGSTVSLGSRAASPSCSGRSCISSILARHGRSWSSRAWR